MQPRPRLALKIEEAKKEKEKDFDFLSSIEVLIADHADVIAMQVDMGPTWKWCERVKENNRLKFKCSFCGNTFSRGISRMKHHLAGTSKDASPCAGGPNKPLPPFVRQQCLDMLHALLYECDDEDDSSL
ncbi:hypothetical protein EJ110_NYTH53024 [Nymphaea thermarum]|nr:hypothetical protein EJ110_NYTH53024 [Nymphaea thermarum]